MKLFSSFVTSLLFCSLAVQGQTVKGVNLYGYKQPVISGAPPKISYNEGGQENPAPRAAKYNYLIYISGPNNIRIYPTEIWLMGKQYGVKDADIKKTPIVHTNVNIPEYSKPVVLVPKTSKTVFQLSPTATLPKKGLAAAKTTAQKNELVVVYKMGGRFYYAAIKKLSLLEPMAMQ